MRDPATIRLLPDRCRLHLNDGPIDLIVEADGSPVEVRKAYEATAERFVTILDELCSELPLIRSQVTKDSTLPTGPIARCMYNAVRPYSNRSFITPMATVAGAVAESVLSAMTEAASLSRAYVNNGGDIAVHLTPGQSFTLGMIERPDDPSLFGTFVISAASNVRGIATSGWRGRSFSLGIADAVTVLAANAAQADAAATIIANAVDLPGHSAITRIPARNIAPDSDLLDLPVTRAVGELSGEEVKQALDKGQQVAEDLRAKGLIQAAALCLNRYLRIVQNSPKIFPISRRDGLLKLSAAEDESQFEFLRRSTHA
jgi:ApbE superfamily uncharacterized protein (UPF0280 family)